MGAADPAALRVLRLCSVFEPPDGALSTRGVRFDPIGGMQNHTAQLTRALDALNVAQDVVTHRPPGAARTQYIGARAVVHRCGLPVAFARQCYGVRAAALGWRLASRVDVVHAHLGEDVAVLVIALAAARHAGIPLVITIHTSLRHTFRGAGVRAWVLKTIGGQVEREVCRRAEVTIVLTSRLAACLDRDGLSPGQIRVIPPGINPADFGAESPDPFPGVGHPRVLYVGRLADQKGLDTLVEALARLRSPMPQVLLVGDGPQRPAIEAAVRRHGLNDHVRITGFRPHREIPSILRHGDIFCLPSRYEELSSALLEAMRAGLPIVASRVGGAAEALGPGGRLVAPDDPVALADALDALLENPEEAARLARLARDRADRYEWPRLAAEILAVYRSVARPPGSRHNTPRSATN